MVQLQVKVCCIRDLAEAELAARHGATAIGLVGPMPSGLGPIPLEQITKIVSGLSSSEQPAVRALETFLLTSAQDPQEIVAQQRATGASTLQLVDALPGCGHAVLRERLPEVRLVQVLHLGGAADGEALLEQVRAAAPHVDALLLDSGNPGALVKELGGTGRTHDWELSRRIVEESELPVWLAGGLRPENVAAAVAAVRPNGVDVCSGLRDAAGRLQEARLEAFVAALRAS